MYCFDERSDVLIEPIHLVNDYAAFCRQLSPTARTVFVDMGASLQFHDGATPKMPLIEVIDEYRKFGIHFDHIYGFEITPTEPAHVFASVPELLMASYHWSNVGVSSDPESKLN